jgi:D-erythronate 2-dehydrogenase
MKVVITGGSGFLGSRLARRLIELGELKGSDGAVAPIDEIVLADIHVPSDRPAWADARVAFARGDIADSAWTRSLVDRDDVSIFHLASVVSAQAETDLALALRINIDGTRSILDAALGRNGAPRFVATSTCATFGGELPGVCTDSTKQTPQTTYGATKVILELLVNDYTRRGAIDGRVARLPTVIVRPGAANLAASSFASAIFREPLAGRDYDIPVAPETRVAVMGVRTAVAGLIALHEAHGDALGVDRAVSFPNVPVTAGEMAETLRRVCGDRQLGRLSWKPEPGIQAIVSTWPSVVDASRALALGVPPTDPLERIVRDAAAELAPRPMVAADSDAGRGAT